MRILAGAIAKHLELCMLEMRRQPSARATRRCALDRAEQILRFDEMTSDLDAYRSANLLLQQYGAEGAPLIAANRADAFLNVGDLDGQRVWKSVLAALEELTRSTLRPDERLN